MNDYTDLLYTLLSIVIFSLLMVQANHVVLASEEAISVHEYEKTALALAQSVIDEARKTAFDQNTVDPADMPEGFREAHEFGPPAGMALDRHDFSVFDHYHGLQETVSTVLGNFDISATVTYVESTAPFQVAAGPTFSKRLVVEVGHAESEGSVSMSYIKTFF